jgi:hypothetical protein
MRRFKKLLSFPCPSRSPSSAPHTQHELHAHRRAIAVALLLWQSEADEVRLRTAWQLVYDPLSELPTRCSSCVTCQQPPSPHAAGLTGQQAGSLPASLAPPR